MSLFNHNSKLWEQISAAWHGWGVFVSLLGFFASLACVGIAKFWEPFVSITPGLYELLFWSAVFSAFKYGGGVLFHVWATYQHSKVLRNSAWEEYT